MLVVAAVTPLGDRLEVLRAGLGYTTSKELAATLRRFLGMRTNHSRISEWRHGKADPSPETLAAISLLHPDPVACFRYLTGQAPAPAMMVGYRPWLHAATVPGTSAHGTDDLMTVASEAINTTFRRALTHTGGLDVEHRAWRVMEVLLATITAFRGLGVDTTELDGVAQRLTRHRVGLGDADSPTNPGDAQ